MNRYPKFLKAAVFLAAFFSAAASLTPTACGQSLASFDQELSQVIARIAPGVAAVVAHLPENRIPLFPGHGMPTGRPVDAVVGSGLVIDTLGHILTTLTLVDGGNDFEVYLSGRELPAKLVGTDRRHNLAVLKIEGSYRPFLEISAFPPLEGRLALAYGRAIGRFGYPALGIIAGRQNDGSYLMSGTLLPGLLGGGVFDLTGRLIGIISSGSIDSDAGGRGSFGGIIMIPAAIAMSSATRIICCGDREAGYLGIEASAIELVSPEGKVLREAVVITQVDPGSPAAAAGMVVGDIITRFNRQDIADDRELQKMVSSAGADSTVTIDYLHGRQNKAAVITLVSQSPQKEQITVTQQGRPTLDIGRRIDSVRLEILRLQKELDLLLDRVESAR